MQKAIEITANNIENAPNIKRLLFNLSRGLNRVGTNEEIRHLIDEFELSIDTFWSKILGNNIYFSLTQGIRVDLALDELEKILDKYSCNVAFTNKLSVVKQFDENTQQYVDFASGTLNDLYYNYSGLEVYQDLVRLLFGLIY